MHFHLPKPLHGWREFAGEVGIIVLGVLIALAAEQLVVFVHDRRVADQAEADIRAELSGNDGYAADRVAIGSCIRASLTDLQKRLVAAGDSWPGLHNTLLSGGTRGTTTGSLYAFRRPIGPPKRLWLNSAWSTAMNSGAISGVDRARFVGFSELYVMVSLLDRLQEQELGDYGQLMPVVVPMKLDSGTRLQLLTLVSRLDTDNATIERLAAVFTRAAAENGIGPDKKWLENSVKWETRHHGRCVRYGRSLDNALSIEGGASR
jgi:hypothetical protein